VKALNQFLTISLIFLSLGCSNQWREVDVDFDAAELDEVFTAASAESTDSVRDQIVAMKEDSATAVYFATGPGALGPVVSIASLYSFAFLGSAEADIGYWDIDEVSVILLDRATNSGHEVGFVFRYKLSGSSSYVTHMFMGSADMSGKKYRAVLTNNGQNVLALESFDVVDGDLAPVIKLKAYDFDAQGNEMDNGQFSTMVGFGG
jgi:hypothetical protein